MQTNMSMPCSKQPMKFVLAQTGVHRETFSWVRLNAMKVYTNNSAVTTPVLLNLQYPSRQCMLIITIQFHLVNGQCLILPEATSICNNVLAQLEPACLRLRILQGAEQ